MHNTDDFHFQKYCGPNLARCASIATCGAIATGAARKYFILHQLFNQVMKDQTVSIFASACMFLITFCSKEEGSSSKSGDCLHTVDFLLRLEFVHCQRCILLGCISAHHQKRWTFKSKEQLLQCFSFLPHMSECCNCFSSSLGLFGGRFWWRNRHPSSSCPALVHGPLSDQATWPHLGCWVIKSWCREQGEECTLLS